MVRRRSELPARSPLRQLRRPPAAGFGAGAGPAARGTLGRRSIQKTDARRAQIDDGPAPYVPIGKDDGYF